MNYGLRDICDFFIHHTCDIIYTLFVQDLYIVKSAIKLLSTFLIFVKY